MNYGEKIMANAVRKGATEERLAILNEGWSSDEEMRQRFPIIWPLYFKNFDSAVAQRN